jgi:alpha-ribazole phosphatase/probable phosphoglycerate mutase
MASDSAHTRADPRPAVSSGFQRNSADVTRTRLYLVRHGALVTSDEWRYVGQRDIELSDAGRAQITALAVRLSAVSISAVYCSDLVRTVESAGLLAAGRGLNPVACPEFREINIGRWEGMTLDEIMHLYPDEFKVRSSDIASYRIEGGESFIDVRTRALPRLERILHEHAGGTVLVVAHGGLNRVILCEALGLDLNSIVRLEQSYACLNCIDYFEGSPVVQLMNETLYEL